MSVPAALERALVRLWWIAWIDLWRAVRIDQLAKRTPWSEWCWTWSRIGAQACIDERDGNVPSPDRVESPEVTWGDWPDTTGWPR